MKMTTHQILKQSYFENVLSATEVIEVSPIEETPTFDQWIDSWIYGWCE
jgi:hypothetical protein